MTLNMEMFLQKVKENKVLYDSNHENYKNNRKKDRIWYAMGAEFDASGDELKRKWKNMRDTYIKYLKASVTSTGATKNYSRWQWAPHMDFLRPYLAFTNTASSKTPAETPDVVDQSSEILSDDSRSSGVPSFNENPLSAAETQRGPRHIEVSVSPMDKAIKYIQINSVELDATEHLFMGLAKTVKTFSPRRQAAVKKMVSQIVMENELQHLDELAEF